MSRVYESLFFHHHPWVVVVSVMIAAAGAMAMILLMRHARTVSRGKRPLWIALAGVSGGAGVWTTHFVAVLGYKAHTDPVYEPVATAASLGVSILVTIAAVTLAVSRDSRALLPLAGGLFGIGIATMHFSGMLAVDWGVAIGWNHALVTAAIVLGIALSAAAFPFSMREQASALPAASFLVVAAIGALHFISMAAIEMPVEPGAERHAGEPPHWLVAEIGGLGLLVIFLALMTLMLHRRERQRAEEEAGRIRNFADLAIEGLAIVDDHTVVAVNTSLTRLLAREERAIVGQPLDAIMPHAALSKLASKREGWPVECDIADATGQLVPVEIAARSTDYQGMPHRVIAVRDLRSRRATEQKIRFLAYNDQLTGLANRESFGRKLDEALAQRGRSGQPVAVLALDLDEFKAINDTLGHHVGDHVLRIIGERIRCATREEDLVARLGGDEFAILQYGQRQPEAAEMLARRLVDLLSRPLIVEGTVVQTGTSVGIAVAEDGADDATVLQKSADLALYRAKDKGRGTFVFFEPHMDAVMRERRALENDLRLALARQAFSLAYQPLYEAAEGRLSGFEALLRWTHPTRGAISPGAFIPLAEQTGLIIPIGQWVLRKACEDAMSWPEHLTVAVNLSAAQFADRKIVATIRDALSRSGLDPARLEVEITESVLLSNSGGVIKSLTEIRSLGVRIAMDDFGTGYSSLSYLRSFPFDRVKIDRSFVSDIESNADSAAIVSAIIGLGHSLGMATTAEGIENSDQLERIRAEGCDHLQGFFLSRPVGADRICEILERDKERVA